MNEKIPIPITFNTYKHHFQFLLKQIDFWQKLEWRHVEAEFVSVGENMIDFYTGDLSVENICTECFIFFRDNNINGKVAFTDWLYPKKYKKIELSDSSEWIIKCGNAHDRYIHIHPAKHSPHTIRVRAATLKTVLALMVKSEKVTGILKENLLLVNYIRTKFLHFSPIKSLQRNKGILKLWELFVSDYQRHYL